MPTIEQVRNSLVAVFEIEDFAKESPIQRSRLVEGFVVALTERLETIATAEPDAFSTGIGAVVSIGRRRDLDRASVAAFTQFVVDMAFEFLGRGVIIRVAMNASQMDRVVVLEETDALRGGFIPVGNSVADAQRIIQFAEPREVLVSESVIQMLQMFDCHVAYTFVKNEPFFSKSQKVLQSYSLVPHPEHIDLFYNPQTPLHFYKRYSNFPPIRATTFEFFSDNGLELELQKVITSAYDAIQCINETMTFLSWNSVIRVLTHLRYDPDDEVLVVSRNDQPGFWTQARRKMYVEYLRAHAHSNEGVINQRRILVYDPDTSEEPMGVDDAALFEDLKTLHQKNTLYSYPANQLWAFDALSDLRYGFTLSKKHRYAIIPVPAPEGVDPSQISPARIGSLLREFPHYDPIDGPMKAIVTAEPSFVDRLLRQFEAVVNYSLTARVK